MGGVLIVGTNWIGDTVMSMPALQALRRARPGARLAVLVKRPLLPLWELHAAPDRVLSLDESIGGTLAAVRAARAESFDEACVLPHSFRSALVPFLAGVPKRIGMPGHARDWMLTAAVQPPEDEAHRHQAWEYMKLMAPEAMDSPLEFPRLLIPAEASEAAGKALAAVPRPRVGLLPGAARGASKRWPAGHFAELARRLAAEGGCGIVLFGSAGERELCADLAQRVGGSVLNLAGGTSLREWAALLAACDVVVANDSGGMHLAAAVGTPVAAIYGITDPAKTGPLGRRCTVLQEGRMRARDIPRASPEAAKCLASIAPEQVYKAALGLLSGG